MYKNRRPQRQWKIVTFFFLNLDTPRKCLPDGFSRGHGAGMDGHRGFPHPVRASTVSPLCFWLSSFLTHPGTCPWWPSHSLYVLHHWHIKFWKMLKPFVPLFFLLPVLHSTVLQTTSDICVAPNQVVPSQRTAGRVAFCFRSSNFHCFSQPFWLRFTHLVGVFFITKRKDGDIATHSVQRAFAPSFQVLLPLLQGHFDFLH